MHGTVSLKKLKSWLVYTSVALTVQTCPAFCRQTESKSLSKFTNISFFTLREPNFNIFWLKDSITREINYMWINNLWQNIINTGNLYADHDVRCYHFSLLKMMCRCCRFMQFRSCIASFRLSYVIRSFASSFFPTEDVTVFLVRKMMPAYRTSILCKSLMLKT